MIFESPMRHARLTGVLVVCTLASVCRITMSTADDEGDERQFVQLSMVGLLKIEESSATITAKGEGRNADVTFELAFRNKSTFRDAATELNGQAIAVRGTLEQRRIEPDDPERPHLVFVPASKPVKARPNSQNKVKHFVTAVCRGVVHTGIVAIGSETTGIVMQITKDGKYSWELAVSEKWSRVVNESDGKPITVSGPVLVKKGIAIPLRWIVSVRAVLDD